MQRSCFWGILLYKNIAYRQDLEAIPKSIELANGETLEVDQFIASGRPAAVGLLKKPSKTGQKLVAKKARDQKYEKEINDEKSFFSQNEERFQGRVIPIVGHLKAKDGTSLLLKPYVEGDSLISLVLNKKLNNSQLASLKELFSWTERYSDSRGIPLDINPLNIVWVDNPESMLAIGISQPAFVFYELTPSGSKVDTFLYRKILSRVKSYEKPGEVEADDFPLPELATEEAF